MLGDAGLPNDDASYTGEVDPSSFSVQYWRDKATEFQRVLNAVDETARTAADFMAVTNDQGAIEALSSALSEYEMQKTALRIAAEGINLGASAINAAGGRFPSLSIPQGLGILPLALPAAAIAAFAAAATLIAWGVKWIEGVNERMRYAALMQGNDPEITRILARGEAAQLAAQQSPITAISGAVKWVGIGVLILMAWPMLRKLMPSR